MGTPDKFIVEPLCIRYQGRAGFADLAKCLEDSSSSKPLTIRKPEDILLSLDGRVQQAFRFTPFGLYSLCRRLSPNLGAVIMDLSGSSNRPSGKLPADLRVAVGMLNNVIRLRFDEALSGSRMIVDQLHRTIDGIVGEGYEFLSNLELFTSANESVLRMGGDFLSAAVVGRRVLLRYVHKKQWGGVLPPGDSQRSMVGKFARYAGCYRMGWSFSNSETGQSAVRVGLLVVDSTGAASQRVLFNRKHTKGLRWTGEGGVVACAEKVSSLKNWPMYARGLETLNFRYLPPARTPMDASLWADQLAAELGKKITKAAARQAASELYSPASLRIDSPGWQPPSGPSPIPPGSRPYYDLYEALTSMAGGYPPQDQENIECLAYELLRGRFIPLESAVKKRKIPGTPPVLPGAMP